MDAALFVEQQVNIVICVSQNATVTRMVAPMKCVIQTVERARVKRTLRDHGAIDVLQDITDIHSAFVSI
jgi:hypothetical protein